MRNVSYIIKRIIIGVGIALVLAFLKSTPVFALNGNFDSVLMCSNSLGCNTSTTLPYSYAYSDSARINFSSLNLVQGKTYNISFYMNITSPSFTFGTGYPQLFVIDANNNATRAYPDRGESLLVNNTGGNTYSVNWTFELDNTGGNYVGAYVIFTFSANYNANIYSTYINSSNFLYFDSADPSGNQDIINNQNNNTQNIINNNNTNTQDIINNQNESTQEIIENGKICHSINKAFIKSDGKFLTSIGGEGSHNDYGISNYIRLYKYDSLSLLNAYPETSAAVCFYDKNKSLISCKSLSNLQNNYKFDIPDNSYYMRLSFRKSVDLPIYYFCTNSDSVINDSIENINNSLNDDSVDTNQASNFFNNFTSNSHGISGIITAPLRLINSFTTAQCSPLEFDLPFVHNHVSLPCMRGIYEEHFGVFFSLWQLITTGYICYHVCINLYSKIHNLQNPNNDRIEVLNL